MFKILPIREIKSYKGTIEMEKKIINMKEFINIHLNGSIGFYITNKIEKPNYDIYYNDIIDDEYWNKINMCANRARILYRTGV